VKPAPLNSTAHLRALALATALAAAAAALPACHGERSDDPPRQFLPDMDDSPKFKPQTQTEFFSDGRAMRGWVPGTVAFGYDTDAQGESRARFLKDDDAFHRGYDKVDEKGEPVFADSIPVPVTRELILRGQQRFNIYCSVCHGYLGDGQGNVGKMWASPVANFHDAKYLNRAQKEGKDGFVFYTIRNGVPAANPDEPTKMPSYADKVTEQDAWAIVAYVRTLQAVWVTDLSKLPADKLQQMNPSRPPAPPPEKPSAAPVASPGSPPVPAPVPAPGGTAPGGGK
jgi:mono/diheme cytochrome c family protein